MPQLTQVTWILPVKNGMPFLAETLQSINNQTYKNWQIIAWDNGSEDGSIDVLRSWIPKKMPGMVVTDRPLGLAASLAAMIEICDSEFCARIDADDINIPTRLEKELKFLLENPDFAVVGSQLLYIDACGRPFGSSSYPIHHADIICAMLASNPLGHPSVTFRRSSILKVGSYRDVGKVNVEDYDLWMRVAANYRLANLQDQLVHYRIHPQSVTQRDTALNLLQAAMNDRLVKCGSPLFGLDQGELVDLIQGRSRSNLAMMYKSVRHIRANTGASLSSIVGSRFFHQSWQNRTHRNDVAARLVLYCLRRGGSNLLCKIARDIFSRGRTLVSRLGHCWIKYRNYQRRRQWFKNFRLQNVSLHPTIEWTGNSSCSKNIEFGSGSVIERDTTIWLSPEALPDACLFVSKRVFIGRNSYIGVHQSISIGDNTIIGAYCYIISGNHRFESRDIPIRDQGFSGAPIQISEDVWIGTHVVILPGVTIAKGAIIAAGSIVNRDVGEFEIWGGVPARRIKMRS